MRTNMQTAELMRSMVPVSRFNKGEAAKIFDEVSKTGIKIAVKNNKPACVLLSPDRYEALMEEIEDLILTVEAERRIAEGGPTSSQAEVMQRLGITQADIDAAEDVEID
ncbi:MAG: type II toxin-antitoxin system Phd/YefM family antitoxin [Defluviitaleaceae bacterium]|nr:type II toxin-antitoxin system Phd/YefM family antitoxin [Defluviitaleaceae bacterium]MCL2240629.1 type II toxin-antitoxin system Phd/YefM family antitoxin [Defluviitaleaceae bacterium]